MSIPRRDPNFTMTDLEKVGQELLDAAYAYWEAAHKAGIGGAIIWLKDYNGRTVIFTRGEYHEMLMRNIGRIGRTSHFGALEGDELEEEPQS